MSTDRAEDVFRVRPTAVSFSINQGSVKEHLINNVTGGGQLTCIEDNRLQCDANTLERGRPLCRLASEFGKIA